MKKAIVDEHITFHFDCPYCDVEQTYEMEDAWQGQEMECDDCGKIFELDLSVEYKTRQQAKKLLECLKKFYEQQNHYPIKSTTWHKAKELIERIES